MTARPNPIRRNGLRARVIRATARQPRSLSDIVRVIPHETEDTAVRRLRVRDALATLKRARLVARTPDGWRATAAGARLIQQLEHQP